MLFGPGLRVSVQRLGAVGSVAELDGLVGVPNFTANADLNLGVAFRL